MKNFIAIVLLKSSNLSNEYVSYDETILSVRAENLDKARESARDYAKSCETTYCNSANERIKVEFEEIVDLNYQLRDKEDLKDNERGRDRHKHPISETTELYSRSFSNIQAYKNLNQ